MSEWDDYNILPKRFIDLNKSVLDDEKSDTENGVYVFKEKVYYNQVENPFPGGVIKWGRKTDRLQSAGIFQKLQRFGYYKIRIDEHKILPEPFSKMNIDENGDIVYVDGLLCAITYYDYVKKRKREIEKADQNLAVTKANYDTVLDKYGAELSKEEKEMLEIQ